MKLAIFWSQMCAYNIRYKAIDFWNG